MAEGRLNRIERILREELATIHVEVVDDSALHTGHAGAVNGAGHYRVLVVSKRFEGLSRVAAQRLVYEALGDLVGDEIHALQIVTVTPEAWTRE